MNINPLTCSQYTKARVIVEHASMHWMTDPAIIPPGSDIEPPCNDEALIRQSVWIPRCECKDCSIAAETRQTYGKECFDSYYSITPYEADDLTPHHFLLMSSHMCAFILKDRIHGMLTVVKTTIIG